MRKLFVAACAVLMAVGTYAADWEYDASAGTISDGVWTFTAKSSGTNLTVNNVTTNGYPTVVSPLDFSKKVVNKDDASIVYTITDLEALFWYYQNGHKYRAGGEYVGEFTLPGEGLVTMGSNGTEFNHTYANSSLTGDIVVPSTVTSIGRYWFQNSKITSITFAAGSGKVGSSMCAGCASLTSVVFKVGGAWTFDANSKPFSSCGALREADLSGVVAITATKNYAAFSGSSALTNIVLNSKLVLSNNSGSDPVGNALFNGNTKLATIRFTGAAPDELPNWISSDGGFLGIFSSSQDITTIIPADCRNIENSEHKGWEDYSATGELNLVNSTWAAEYVKSDVTDLSKRKLLMDGVPTNPGPSVTAPTTSDIWTNAVTITVGGGGLKGGTISVSVTNAAGEVTGPMSVAKFGDSCTFNTLAPDTEYTVIVVAANANGATTNSATVFSTMGVTSLAARAIYTASDTTLTFRYDSVDWSKLGTVYEVGTGSNPAWATAHASTLTKVVFDESFTNVHPTSCASWFKTCNKLTTIEGLGNLDTSEVTDMNNMFNACSSLKTLDLSTFRTPKLTNCEYLFYNCGQLTTIWANENFVTYYAKGTYTFRSANRLVGGNGSANTNNIYQTYQYARVDREGMPGLFTYKDQPSLTTKPTILASEFHDRTSDGVMLNIAGMDLGSAGTIAITIHPASDPTAVTTNITVSAFGDIAITGLAADTAYLFDVTVANSFGSVSTAQQSIKTRRITPEGATAKLVFDNDKLTATFYFDALAHDENGATNVYAIGSTGSTWTSHATRGSITNVVFDASFYNYYPTNCKQWFYGFAAMVSIDGMQYFDTSEVTNMHELFRGCSVLASIDLSGFDTGNVTDMGGMFRQCGCKVLNLTGFNTAKVTTMAEMFAYTGYNRLNLSSFDTSNVTGMSGMFSGCKLNQICVSELWSTAKVAAGTKVFGSNLGADTVLVGGEGTTYAAGNDDVSYARIDGGPDSDTPGYFTYAPAGSAPLTLPVITSVVVSGVTTNGATITVAGTDLDYGNFKVEIYDNDWLLTLTSATVDDWGSVQVTGLHPASVYYARAIAKNGESGLTTTYSDVQFETAAQTDVAWVTLKNATAEVADNGTSGTFSVLVDTCNITGTLILTLNGTEVHNWSLTADSAGTTFSTTEVLQPYTNYVWQFKASGECDGVKALATAGDEFTASVREIWVDVAFDGGSYDVSSGVAPTATESPEGTWTPASDSIAYAASAATGTGNDVLVKGSMEAYAVDESAAVPSGVKAVFGFVAYDGALKPAVWANGAWHAFGFRCFTPGDTLEYTLSFDFQSATPKVRAVVGTETSSWYEIDASSKSLTGFVFDGAAELGDFRGWQYLTGADGGEIILRPPTFVSGSGAIALGSGTFTVGLQNCVKDAWYTPFYKESLSDAKWVAGESQQCLTEGAALTLAVDTTDKESLFVKIVISTEKYATGAELE